MDNFKGKYADLLKRIDTFKIPGSTEVELIINPPEGFEKMMKPMSIPMDIKIPEDKKGEPPVSKKDKNVKDEIPPLWFMKKLKSILKDNSLQRHATNKREGDLDTKHLYKAFTTGRVFTDKDIISKKSYNIVLCVDCSGSMGGKSANIAALCMKHFTEQFQQIVNLSVITFNQQVLVVKTPHKKLDEKEREILGDKIISEPGGNFGGGNHDHSALLKAEELMKPLKGEKIIVIISDCEPSCGCENEGCYHVGRRTSGKYKSYNEELRETAKMIEHRGTHILSLSIENKYEHHYKHGAILEKVADMYPSLIKLITQVIRRRNI